MTITKKTIAATFTAVLIGSLSINPASAAVPTYGWSEVSFVTHGGSAASSSTQIGHISGEFNRNDLSAITHKSVPVGVKPLAKASFNGYSRNDITAITHN